MEANHHLTSFKGILDKDQKVVLNPTTPTAAAGAMAKPELPKIKKARLKKSRLLPYTYMEALDATILTNKLSRFCERLMNKACQLDKVKRQLIFTNGDLTLKETCVAGLDSETAAADAKKAAQVIATAVSYKAQDESISDFEEEEEEEEMGEEGIDLLQFSEDEEEEDEEDDWNVEKGKGEKKKKKKKKTISLGDNFIATTDDDDERGSDNEDYNCGGGGDKLPDLPTRRSRRLRCHRRPKYAASSETDGETESTLKASKEAAAEPTPTATQATDLSENMEEDGNNVDSGGDYDDDEKNWQQSQSLL